VQESVGTGDMLTDEPLSPKFDHIEGREIATGQGQPGSVQMKYTWCSLQPDKMIYHQGVGVDLTPKLQSAAAAHEESGLLLVASVERIVMPGRLTESIQVLLTVGNTVRRTPKARTPIGKISAAIDAVNKEVVDVVKRCLAEGLSLQQISKVTNVSEELVKAIGQQESGLVDPNIGDKMVLVDVPINSRLYAAVSQEAISRQEVKLTLVGAKRQVLASHTLMLSDLVGAPHKDGKGVLHIAHPDTPESLFKLFTRFVLVPYHR